jgi:hypothetical protein
VGRFRDAAEFAPTIDAAAGQLGISPAAVEKDYWVSEALRALADGYGRDFVFKGGTSLSKAYRIIERFSEDIDVLVVPGQRSKGETHSLMKSMGEAAGAALGSRPRPTPQSQTGVHKSFWLTYPAAHGPDQGVGSEILLEMGIRGGPQPSQWLSVGCLLGDLLRGAGTSLSAFSDLQLFEVAVLHPGRTLLEKLGLIHSKLGSNPSESAARKHARHYYDIYQLLGDDHTLALLRDRAEVEQIMRNIDEVSESYFGGGELRPIGGWARSPAFDPDGPSSRLLRAAYDATMADLYFGPGDPPAFREVCLRLAGVSELL